MMWLNVAVLLGMVPGFTTGYPLKLCNGLNASQHHLRQLELTMHAFPGALLEGDCVEVDPCAQKTSRGEALAAGVWHWRNSSALRMGGYEDLVRSGDAGTEAYNWFAIEYARVPEGIHLRACEPNFDAYRLHQELVCADNTEVSISKGLGAPACPSSASPYSLLDCMLSVERRPVVETLPYRAKNVHMAFGSRTWYEACTGNISAEAAHLCSVLETSYELHVPLATTVSRTQMVWYDFSPGFGCFLPSEVTAGHRLSRLEFPNTIEGCPPVANGVHASSLDPTACDFSCNAGYTKMPTGCVLGCTTGGGVALTATRCADGEYASGTCSGGGVTYYECAPCAEVPGSAVSEWSELRVNTCLYTPCAAGKFGRGNKCMDCPVNTISPLGNASACQPCDSPATGLYQPAPGQTECVPCFSDPPAVVCPAGQTLHTSFADIRAYFNRTGLHQHENMTAFCMHAHACLPCEPGSFAREGEAQCTSCATGHYQPHYQSVECFACSLGQTTLRTGATSPTECVCEPGFE